MLVEKRKNIGQMPIPYKRRGYEALTNGSSIYQTRPVMIKRQSPEGDGKKRKRRGSVRGGRAEKASKVRDPVVTPSSTSAASPRFVCPSSWAHRSKSCNGAGKKNQKKKKEKKLHIHPTQTPWLVPSQINANSARKRTACLPIIMRPPPHAHLLSLLIDLRTQKHQKHRKRQKPETHSRRKYEAAHLLRRNKTDRMVKEHEGSRGVADVTKQDVDLLA